MDKLRDVLDYTAQNSLVHQSDEDSLLHMILKSIWKISVFAQDLAICKASALKSDIMYLSFINNLNLSQAPEAKNVFDLFVYILKSFPPWNPEFKVCEMAKKICDRCKMDTEYPVECSYGLKITANSLRENKELFENLTFEMILKIIRIELKMPCDKEGCGKESYVQRMIIKKLPNVFTIALEWEQNETEEEIFNTASVFATEIDISKIYQYEGDSEYIKYHLVSMVCSYEDKYNCVAHEYKYNCVAHEDNRWVRHFSSKTQVIGDWNGVLSMFRELHIRPEILFFENRKQIEFERKKAEERQIESGMTPAEARRRRPYSTKFFKV